MEECFATMLQKQIDAAACQVLKSHKKWPLVANVVNIPSGVYRTKRPIRLRSGVAVRGEHQGSVVILSELEGEDPVFYSEQGEELYACSVSGIHARAEKTFEGAFLKVHSANRNCSFSELFIENFNLSIESDECYTTKFSDIGVYACNDGPRFHNLTNGRLWNFKVENCAGNGLYLGPSKTRTDSVSGTEITGYVAQGNGRCGVLVDRVDQVRFSSLFLEGNNRPAMRREGDDANYAQLRLVGDKTKLNKRNANVFFDNIFITPGRSNLKQHTAVEANCGEVISFRGGLIRNHEDIFEYAFQVSENVTSFVAEDIAFERWERESIFDVSSKNQRICRNFYTELQDPPACYQRVSRDRKPSRLWSLGLSD